MRKLKLVNDTGQDFLFGYRSGVLVSSISDIGFTRELTYADFGDSYKKTKEKNPTQTITFTLTFLKGYQGFRDFVSFMESSKSFLLYYYTVDWRYCHCEIESLSKTQLSRGVLECTLSIKRLSYWFRDVTGSISISIDGEAKTYPYSYSYRYGASVSGRISVTNGGYAKAPLRILISGAFDHPEIICYRDGVEEARMKINYKSSDAILEVDAFPLDQKIEITEDGKTMNAYEYQDFGVDNFLFLDRGTHTLEFRPNVATPPSCTITMREGYLGD